MDMTLRARREGLPKKENKFTLVQMQIPDGSKEAVYLGGVGFIQKEFD